MRNVTKPTQSETERRAYEKVKRVMEGKQKNKQVHVYLEPSLYDDVRAVAFSQDRKVSEILRSLLINYVKKHKTEQT